MTPATRTLTEQLCASAEDTRAAGRKLGELLQPGALVLLYGDLGAGKTCFTSGLVTAFGISEIAVSSPTFSIMNRYDGRLPVYHFDLFRLRSAAEARDAGLEEFAWADGICLVEWPDIAQTLLPPPFYRVELSHTGAGLRRVCISQQTRE